MSARNRRKRFGHDGFTLIEILVATLVMGILIGGGIASYGRFSQKRQVEEAALHFANQLRVIQKQADSGQKPDRLSCVGPSSEPLQGYQVDTSSNRDEADVTVYCGATPEFLPAISLRQQYSNVEFDNTFLITFRPISAGVDFATGENQVIVRDVSGNYKYRITVDAGGAISVEEL